MFRHLSARDLQPLVGSAFRLAEHPAAPPLTLAAVQATNQPRRITRDEPCFSALFRAPVGFHLPQSTYLLDHVALGCVAIFLVPLGSDAQGPRFQAVFA